MPPKKKPPKPKPPPPGKGVRRKPPKPPRPPPGKGVLNPPKPKLTYPTSPTIRQERSLRGGEGIDIPQELFRAVRIPFGGFGTKFSDEEVQTTMEKRRGEEPKSRLRTYPAVPDPETQGFSGTPGTNKLNMFYGGKTVFAARTKEQAVNFIAETRANKNSTFGIYKISNVPEYDVVRIEPTRNRTDRDLTGAEQKLREASIDRVADAYKKQWSNNQSPLYREILRKAKSHPEATAHLNETYRIGAKAYIDNTATGNGEHALKGPVKPKDVRLVELYNIRENYREPRPTSRKTLDGVPTRSKTKIKVTDTRLDQIPNYLQIQALKKAWGNVHSNVMPRRVEAAGRMTGVLGPPKRPAPKRPAPPEIDRNN